jgi:hypothetical protein
LPPRRRAAGDELRKLFSKAIRFLNGIEGHSGGETGMTPVKAAFLFLAMLSAIAICGVGIYAADASSGHAVVDGYGVGAVKR